LFTTTVAVDLLRAGGVSTVVRVGSQRAAETGGVRPFLYSL